MGRILKTQLEKLRPEAIYFHATDDTRTARLFLEVKEAAMRAHATQISVASPFFALTNKVGRPIMAMEFYRLIHGEPGGPRDADGRETDLFGGLPT